MTTTIDFTTLTSYMTETIDLLISVITKFPELVIVIVIIFMVFGLSTFITGFLDNLLKKL